MSAHKEEIVLIGAVLKWVFANSPHYKILSGNENPTLIWSGPVISLDNASTTFAKIHEEANEIFFTPCEEDDISKIPPLCEIVASNDIPKKLRQNITTLLSLTLSFPTVLVEVCIIPPKHIIEIVNTTQTSTILLPSNDYIH